MVNYVNNHKLRKSAVNGTYGTTVVDDDAGIVPGVVVSSANILEKNI